MSENRPYRFIFTGGGTGGHIYPAIAVASRVREEMPGSDILFVGAKGKMEMHMVPDAGFDIKGLWISGLQRKLTLRNLLFPLKVIVSMITARRILKSYKPNAVAGFGGYASGPIIREASRLGIPSLIQEQNSYAGLTNKLLGKKANRICVAYKNMDRYFPEGKIVMTGNPVRKDILRVQELRGEGMTEFNLDPTKPVVLVLGGSLGARTINDSVAMNIRKVIDSGVQMIWQTGRLYYDEMIERTADKDLGNIRIVQFIKRMDLAYAAADVVVSRAGALAISELCLVNKPVIFVPSPNVAEDHQTKNAMALVDEGAAMMVKDSESRQQLIEEALKLLADDSRRRELSENIQPLGKPEATQDIAKELIELVHGS